MNVAIRPDRGYPCGRTQNSTVCEVRAYWSWKNGRCVRHAAWPSKYIALRETGLSKFCGSVLPRELTLAISSRSPMLSLSVS